MKSVGIYIIHYHKPYRKVLCSLFKKEPNVYVVGENSCLEPCSELKSLRNIDVMLVGFKKNEIQNSLALLKEYQKHNPLLKIIQFVFDYQTMNRYENNESGYYTCVDQFADFNDIKNSIYTICKIA